MDYQYGLAFPISEVKATGDAWTVEGYASTYGNVDHGGDVVLRGAFDDSLKSDRRVRFLLGHDQTKILGTPVDLHSDEKGLWSKFKISKTSLGQDVHTLLKDGALDSFSIGYIPTEFEFDDQGVRLLKQIELLETSLVAVPMNDEALVTGVKQKDSELSMEDHAARVLAGVDEFLARVKDVASLRADDGRRIGAAHFERLKALRVGVDELLALEELPKGTPPMTGTRLRLELARRRAQLNGITETRT